jgi:RecA/RadA recombinase
VGKENMQIDGGVVLLNTIVINLFGEPGAGKSTAAMDITARLKRKGINAEYVSEFAKDKVYENNGEVFKHQEYLFGKQSFKMGRVRDKVQVMVVDSPLILSIIYNNDEKLGHDFDETVWNMFNSYANRNYLLTRKHTYENEGRFQNEEEALEVRKQIINALDTMNITYNFATSSEIDCEIITNKIAEEIRENEQ